MPSYLAIGHLTLDIFPTGRRAGGTVLFAAAQAAALGYETRIVTSTTEECLHLAERMLGTTAIQNVPTADATTFDYANWKPAGRRILKARAPALAASDVPASWLQSDIWHIAPVADDVAGDIVSYAPKAGFAGITPQGWMRDTAEDGTTIGREWRPDADVIRRAGAIVYSREDQPQSETVANAWSREGPVVVVTSAHEGSFVFVNGQKSHVPALPVEARTEIGAGDVFAATLFIGLAQDTAITEAVSQATAAAAIHVRKPIDSPPPGLAVIRQAARRLGAR